MQPKTLGDEFELMDLKKGWQRFFPISGTPFSILAEFGIICAGMSFHRPVLDISRPNFNQHSAYFCVSGQLNYLTPKGIGAITTGDVWLVPALYPHRYWVDDSCKYIWVHFQNQEYWRNYYKSGERKIISHRINHLEHIAKAMLEYAECWNDQEVMEGWARMLVMLLRLELIEPNDKLSRLRTVLTKAWHEVHINPAKEWRTQELAKLAHMSLTHFNRSMNQVYGTSARGMLTHIRLEKAINLMRKTNFTLDRIAEMTGYSSGFALSKAFQRVYGNSPRQVCKLQ